MVPYRASRPWSARGTGAILVCLSYSWRHVRSAASLAVSPLVVKSSFSAAAPSTHSHEPLWFPWRWVYMSVSASTDGTRATLPHAQSTVAQYTERDAECDQLPAIVVDRIDRTYVGRRRQVARCKQLFILHLPTVGVPWPNILSPCRVYWLILLNTLAAFKMLNS